MPERLLIIGNKNYSSWSLRAWLALAHSGLPFKERLLPLDTPEFAGNIHTFSPAGQVPVLIEGEARIFESLAILEHLADQVPALWPRDNPARAHARSISCEMHAGFAALRGEMPMNIRAQGRKVEISDACRRDIARIQAIWADCRQRFGNKDAEMGGPYLFGRFTNADAMFAPVATRLRTYGVEVDEIAGAYIDTIFADPHFAHWHEAALAEPMRVEADEAGA